MSWTLRLVRWSVRRPRTVLALVALITALSAAAFPRVRVDTDPENMLERDQPDRLLYDQIQREFGLHDFIVTGIADPAGIYRAPALAAIARVADEVALIPGVIAEDLVSLRTSNDARASGGVVDIRPAMETVPKDEEGIRRLRESVEGNPFLNGKVVSEDGRAAALYVPIASKDQSRRIASEIRRILDRERLPGQATYVAGLPVAEDTFGHEMFVQMAIVAPLAFAGILLLVFVLFRETSFLLPVGLTAALSVTWTMGAMIATGHTVHIMSSMIPVFLMPIAVLDGIHVLSELHDRRDATRDAGRALLEGMEQLARPMLFASLTTAAGFASLAFCGIPPVRVFGLFVALGIAIAWALTHTMVPAILTLGFERRSSGIGAGTRVAARDAGGAERTIPAAALDRVVGLLGNAGFHRARPVIVVSAALLLIAGFGMAKLRVDDNPVRWFRPGHPMRVADDAMNRSFSGTYMAHLLVEAKESGAMHRPSLVRYIERIQERLERDPAVGNTSSHADVVKRLNRVLHEGDSAHDRVPDSEEDIGQLLFVFQGSAQPGELDNFLTPDARRANVWVQMTSGENLQMERVERDLAAFVAGNPPPEPLQVRWSGLNHINLVWQRLMVSGLLQAVPWSFAVVLILMVVEFRSWRLGFLAMIPLTVAITVAYGLVGLIGKPCDMPIAVCSALSLGLADDFAIHFFERFRLHWNRSRDLEAANRYVAGPPGRAIARNAIVISLGFLPLAMSSLTPYLTVSLFFAALMLSTAVATLLLLPAALRVAGPRALASFALAVPLVALAVAAGAAPATVAPADLDGAAIMERMNRAYYYAGADMTAGVTMELGSARRVARSRVMSQLRVNVGSGGEQRYLLYFHKPGDVRRMSCMVWKHPHAADERWMFVPLTGKVVKVQAPDRSSFLGSEFLREELSGRDPDADFHRRLRREPVDGRECYVVESLPREPAGFTSVLSWIDAETFLPLRQEFHGAQGALTRVFTGRRIERVPSARDPGVSYPTLMERTMTGYPSSRFTRVVLDSVMYDRGLRAADFTRDHLRAPAPLALTARRE